MRPWTFHPIRFVCLSPVFASWTLFLSLVAYELRGVDSSLCWIGAMIAAAMWYLWSVNWMAVARTTAVGRFVFLLPLLFTLFTPPAYLFARYVIQARSGEPSGFSC